MFDDPSGNEGCEVCCVDVGPGSEIVREEGARERISGARCVDEVVRCRRNMMGIDTVEDQGSFSVEFENDECRGKHFAQSLGDGHRLMASGENRSLFLVGQDDVEIEISACGKKVVDTHLLDHLERARIE